MDEEVEEYDEDGDIVNVLLQDGPNIWLFTKSIYTRRHINDGMTIIAEGKWHTLNDIRDLRRASCQLN